MSTIECYREMAQRKTFYNQSPNSQRKILFVTTQHLCSLQKAISQKSLNAGRLSPLNRLTPKLLYKGYSTQKDNSYEIQQQMSNTSYIEKLRMPNLGKNQDYFACGKTSSCAKIPLNSTIKQNGSFTPTNSRLTPEIFKSQSALDLVNSNKTKQSNIVTPRKKDTPTHKITRLCMIPKEVLKARCSLYFKKSYDNIPVKKTQLRFYIPNSRNRNHQSKTAVASIVPANYSVDAVMKDLLRRKEEVLSAVHRVIVNSNVLDKIKNKNDDD